MTMQIPGQWTFKNEEVATKFDDHVREQLPWYDVATKGMVYAAKQYLPFDGLVYDVGSATGNMARAIWPIVEARRGKIVSVEESKEMAEKWSGPGELIVADAAEVEYEPFDVALCMLVLIFCSRGGAVTILDKLISKCRPGGAIILLEKFNISSSYPGTVMRRMTLEAKREAGANLEQIMEKELSLSGIQRPLDFQIIAERGGWQWFRFGEFAGYVIENKPRNPVDVAVLGGN